MPRRPPERVGRVTLAEAFALTALIAQKEPSRHGRFAVRWLTRYLQERDPTIDVIALVIGSLLALAGPRPAGSAVGPRELV